MFEYLFLAFGPCLNGFGSGCRLVITIDGPHLKKKSRGVMFVVVAMDGNEQIDPIVFGFGVGENNRSCSWFLTELRTVIGSLQT